MHTDPKSHQRLVYVALPRKRKRDEETASLRRGGSSDNICCNSKVSQLEVKWWYMPEQQLHKQCVTTKQLQATTMLTRSALQDQTKGEEEGEGELDGAIDGWWGTLDE